MDKDSCDAHVKVLVTGATGYVGSRLVPRLLERGFIVRAASRSIDKLKARSWAAHPSVELVELDVLDQDSTNAALAGCTHAYYLVHSMNPQSHDFAEADKLAATHMVAACEAVSLKQLIYLGGLGEEEHNLSKHLRSRADVGAILHKAKVPTTFLRAAMIIGSGSASFEILRYLVERLPVMVTPKWVSTPSQPIAIRNVLEYLIGCLDNENTFDKVFDIGGPDVISYRDLMDTYADAAGLSRPVVLPVPVFTPGLSSYWINYITPVPSYIARPLAEGLRNPAVCTESSIKTLVPQKLLSCKEAVRLALQSIELQKVESHWTDAGKIPPAEWCNEADPSWAGGTMYIDRRSVIIEGSKAAAWAAVSQIGGTAGWYYANWLWHVRGWLDRIVGGVGSERGRRHPTELRAGDAVDFWRVCTIEAQKRLLLMAEMKLPGQAALQFELEELRDGTTRITQTAMFRPRGLAGMAYWFAVSPLHEFVFNGMLRGIARASGSKMRHRPQKLQKRFV